jgi:hypothetical protein
MKIKAEEIIDPKAIKIEDGGQSLRYEIDIKNDVNLSIEIKSWDEDLKDVKLKHSTLNKILKAKKIKIIIEVIK